MNNNSITLVAVAAALEAAAYSLRSSVTDEMLIAPLAPADTMPASDTPIIDAMRAGEPDVARALGEVEAEMRAANLPATPATVPLIGIEFVLYALDHPKYSLRTVQSLTEGSGMAIEQILAALDDREIEVVARRRIRDGAALLGFASRN